MELTDRQLTITVCGPQELGERTFESLLGAEWRAGEGTTVERVNVGDEKGAVWATRLTIPNWDI